MISPPAMLPALLLALVVCFQQAKLEDTEEMPSTAVPELMGTNYSYEVNEGSVFRLVCRYKDLGSKATVMWRKNQNYISVGSHIMAKGNIAFRIAILEDQSLQVNNASRADAGDYTCQLGIKDQKLEQQHTLRVKYPPKITNLEPQDGVSTQMGTDVTLKCESDGFPKPKITWTLQDKNITHAEVQDEGRTLYIPKIQPNHAGQYKCISDNGIHSPDEESISVSILFPPQVTIDPNEKDIPVLLDNSVTLKCKVVQANPKPTIKWLFNGTLMPDRTTEEMTIPKMKLSDAGVYKCEVGNSLGQTFENSFTLSVIYPPQVKVTNSWIHTGLGKTTELSCTVDAKPPANVTWLHNSTRVPSHGNKRAMATLPQYKLVIRDFNRNDFGNYTCMAENDVNSAYEIITLSGLATPVDIKIIISPSPETPLLFRTQSYSPVTEFSLKYRKMPTLSDDHLVESTDWTTITIPAQHSDVVYTQQYALPELEVNATYEVVIRAHNDYGWNEPSNVFRFTVTPDNEQQEMEPSNGQQEMESDSSKGTTNSQIQFPALLTVIIMFSSVFW